MAYETGFVAPKGSTGNNTHASIEMPGVSEGSAFNFIVEAIGATPTVTFKFQVSNDAPEVSDANSTWADMPYVDGYGTAETVANTTKVVTTVSTTTLFPVFGVARRFFRKVRLVTSANTNVTYRAEVVVHDTAS